MCFLDFLLPVGQGPSATHAFEGLFGFRDGFQEALELGVEGLDVFLCAGHGVDVEEFPSRQEASLRLVPRRGRGRGRDAVHVQVCAFGSSPFRDCESVGFRVWVASCEQEGVVEFELDDGVAGRVGVKQGDLVGSCVADQVGLEPVVGREDAAREDGAGREGEGAEDGSGLRERGEGFAQVRVAVHRRYLGGGDIGYTTRRRERELSSEMLSECDHTRGREDEKLREQGDTRTVPLASPRLRLVRLSLAPFSPLLGAPRLTGEREGSAVGSPLLLSLARAPRSCCFKVPRPLSLSLSS